MFSVAVLFVITESGKYFLEVLKTTASFISQNQSLSCAIIAHWKMRCVCSLFLMKVEFFLFSDGIPVSIL